jgi:hypothetical protein
VRCRCSPSSKEPCARCQRRIDAEEELRADPEVHPDYDDLVAAEERAYERWLGEIAP